MEFQLRYISFLLQYQWRKQLFTGLSCTPRTGSGDKRLPVPVRTVPIARPKIQPDHQNSGVCIPFWLYFIPPVDTVSTYMNYRYQYVSAYLGYLLSNQTQKIFRDLVRDWLFLVEHQVLPFTFLIHQTLLWVVSSYRYSTSTVSTRTEDRDKKERLHCYPYRYEKGTHFVANRVSKKRTFPQSIRFETHCWLLLHFLSHILFSRQLQS